MEKGTNGEENKMEDETGMWFVRGRLPPIGEWAHSPGLPGLCSIPAWCLAQKRSCDQVDPISICPGNLLRATRKEVRTGSLELVRTQGGSRGLKKRGKPCREK